MKAFIQCKWPQFENKFILETYRFQSTKLFLVLQPSSVWVWSKLKLQQCSNILNNPSLFQHIFKALYESSLVVYIHLSGDDLGCWYVGRDRDGEERRSNEGLRLNLPLTSPRSRDPERGQWCGLPLRGDILRGGLWNLNNSTSVTDWKLHTFNSTEYVINCKG